MGQSDRQGKLRIAMVSTPFVSVPPPQYGGTELVVAELVDGLSDIGSHVTLFATGDSHGGFKHHTSVRAYFSGPVWPPSHTYELEHAAFVVRELMVRNGDFDLVHTHCPSFLPLAPLLGIPVVYTLHHPYDRTLNELYRCHPEVTYVSISHRQLAMAGRFERGAVVHHGLNPARYCLAPAQTETVAFLGRLSEVKAPHLAIEIARRAGLRLRIGGRPHEEDAQYFRREVAWRLEQEHVDYLGELSHGPKVALLSTARALLFPIEWEEPFGLVAIESMLCGCPVLAFGRGAAPELIDEGITGFVARDAAHMASLLSRETRPDRFDRARCREHAIGRFSARRMTEDYLRIYRSACAWSGRSLKERAGPLTIAENSALPTCPASP